MIEIRPSLSFLADQRPWARGGTTKLALAVEIERRARRRRQLRQALIVAAEVIAFALLTFARSL